MDFVRFETEMTEKNTNDNCNDSIRAKLVEVPSDRPITSSRTWDEARDIMSKDVVTVTSTETVIAAVEKMSKNKISCVIVVDNGKIEGIVTETDLLKKVASKATSLKELKVCDIMSSPVHTVQHDLSTLDASVFMESRNIKRLPVVENDRLVGVMTQTDIVRALAFYGMLSNVTEVMSRNVATIQQDSKVIEAVNIMASHRTSCIVVMESDEVVGVFTERDLLNKIIRQQKEPDSVKIQEVMTCPVISIPPDFSVLSASKVMDKEQVRRLVTMDKGKLCGIITQTDILAVLKTKLQYEERKNLSLLEKSERSIFTLNMDDRITYVNSAFLKLFEVCDSQELIGEPFLSHKFWVDPEKRDSIVNQFKNELLINCELNLKTTKGKEISVSLLLTQTKNIHGEINGSHGILSDITDRKRAQKELENLAKFPDENTAPVLRITGDGTILYANKSSKQLLDSWETEPGQLCPEDIKVKVSRALGSGESEAYDVECGESIVSLSFVPIQDSGYVNLYGRDVTFERMAERDLRALNVSLGDSIDELTVSNLELQDFAHVVSHDLKSPVRAIGTLANWLEKDCADKLDNESQERIRFLAQRANRLDSMIDGILQYCGISRIGEEKQQVNLNELVNQISCDLDLPNNITLTIENELPQIVCRKARMSQLFHNLLSNAVKYMDKPEGLISVGCTEEKDYWQFHISDNGPGIEKQDYVKVFELFETLRSCDETDQMGIGLSLVKKIIGIFEGQIWVKSRIGHGSTFFFTIPSKFFPVVNDNKQVCNIIK